MFCGSDFKWFGFGILGHRYKCHHCFSLITRLLTQLINCHIDPFNISNYCHNRDINSYSFGPHHSKTKHHQKTEQKLCSVLSKMMAILFKPIGNPDKMVANLFRFQTVLDKGMALENQTQRSVFQMLLGSPHYVCIQDSSPKLALQLFSSHFTITHFKQNQNTLHSQFLKPYLTIFSDTRVL